MELASGVISGREALHRLDGLVARVRSDFETAQAALEALTTRRAEISRLRAEALRTLAEMRLDVVRSGAAKTLSAAEKEAGALLDEHAAFLETVMTDVEATAASVEAIEAERRTAEQALDAALAAYEGQLAATESRVRSDPAYVTLSLAREEAKATSLRAEQKLELARTDRAEKGKPYESDPLFSYLWGRRFRTPQYRAGGLERMLDNWVAKVCQYDRAWLNYARLIELPDRLAEHVARVKEADAEAEAALEAFEARAFEADGGAALGLTVAQAREELAKIDARLTAAEKHLSDLRTQREDAAKGRSGPADRARRLIEEGLEEASFPDLKVLAAETVTLDDDRLVDALVRLRTEELSLDVGGVATRNLPARRREAVEALEGVRQGFKAQGMDSPYASFAVGPFEAALDAFVQGELTASGLLDTLRRQVRDAGRQGGSFGGRRRDGVDMGDVLGGVVGGIASEVMEEVIREMGRSSGRRGSGWGGSTRPTSRRSGSSGRRGGGGFRSGGGF